jgi:UDP-N-acetylmuramoyl-L-alanyl-D-glutamate--2,6-diaminopimelate ligase
LHSHRPAAPLWRRSDGTWELGPEVRGISDDSRTLRPGEVFVAIRGRSDDGHRHLAEAVERGAVAAVVDDPTLAAQAPPHLPLVLTPSSRRALGELASTWYGHPTRRIDLVGVTGTNGKTTTAVMLTAILRRAGRSAHTVGTLGPFESDASYPLTTPFPLQLQRTLRRLVDAGADAVVMEVSSHGLVQHRVAGCEFDVAVLTSLGRDHLDYHPSLRAYWAAKTRLFKLLARPGRTKARTPVAVLPLEGEGTAAVARHVRVPCLRFALGRRGDVRATRLHPTAWGSRFLLHLGERSVPVRLHLPGAFNVANALAAAAAAHALGASPEEVASGLDTVRHVPGRCERLPLPGGGFAVVDYAHNPDGLAQLLEAVRAGSPHRRLVCVLGGRGHRDPGKLPGMGATVARYAQELVLTTDSPLDEDPRALARAIAAGVPAGAGLRVSYVEDRAEAIARALEAAGPGGVVVVTGRGHEPQQWVGDRVLHRLDADMVREAARRLGRAGRERTEALAPRRPPSAIW